MRRRETDPSEDLITSLLREDAGDRLGRDEVITIVSNLLVAGHDTTTSQIGCSLAAMLGHLDAVERLRQAEASVASAVSESMRYEPNISAIPRTVTATVEVGGIARGPGTLILLAVMIREPRPLRVGRPRSLRHHPFRYAVGTEATVIRHRATLLSWRKPGPHDA